MASWEDSVKGMIKGFKKRSRAHSKNSHSYNFWMRCAAKAKYGLCVSNSAEEFDSYLKIKEK